MNSILASHQQDLLITAVGQIIAASGIVSAAARTEAAIQESVDSLNIAESIRKPEDRPT